MKYKKKTFINPIEVKTKGIPTREISVVILIKNFNSLGSPTRPNALMILFGMRESMNQAETQAFLWKDLL